MEKYAKYLDYLKKYYLYMIIFSLILIIIFIYISKPKAIETIVPEQNLKVDVKGAVTNPGVYELKQGSKVIDALEASGKALENADTTTMNLSKNLEDEMVIIVYTKEEINELTEGSKSVKIVEKECICPEIKQQPCINNPVTNLPPQSNNQPENNTPSSKVSLNNANIDQLMTLTGIGEKKALAIIEYRNQNSGFKTIEELMEVSGIGEATFAKIKDQLTL